MFNFKLLLCKIDIGISINDFFVSLSVLASTQDVVTAAVGPGTYRCFVPLEYRQN